MGVVSLPEENCDSHRVPGGYQSDNLKIIRCELDIFAIGDTLLMDFGAIISIRRVQGHRSVNPGLSPEGD
jgi:hypothetical protein